MVETLSTISSSTTPGERRHSNKSPYIATTSEALKNYQANEARTWYKDSVDPNDPAGKYAFQRLRKTWFTPELDPKFKLHRQDKFYAIGSCFARGLENALARRKITVESAAPEFAKLQPANKEVSGLGFINKYNTYSILNELCWALAPDAEFPRESIVQLTKTTWDDPHTTPTLEFADLQETLEPRTNASGYQADRELWRRDPDSWACRGVARREGECLRQSNSHSIFLADRTRSIRTSSY